MKFWILIIIALLLLMWGVRERFNPATERPAKTDTSLRRTVESMAGTTTGSVVDTYIDAIQKFYDTKYLPEKKTPESTVVNDFANAQEMKAGMNKDALKRIIDYVFLSTAAPPPSQSSSGAAATGGDVVDALCPDGSSPDGNVGLCMSTGKTVTCPSGFTLYSIFTQNVGSKMKCVRQSLTVYDGQSTNPQQNPCTDTSHLVGARISASGDVVPGPPQCIRPSGSSGGTAGGGTAGGGTAGGGTAGGGTAGGGTAGGGTAGGGTAGGGTAGGGAAGGGTGGTGSASGRKQMIFGPTFTGMADGDGVAPNDSSKTNQYPELIGGGATSTSKREAGAGGLGFGFGDLGVGALPTTGGLGSDPNSRFFPTSRSPGDMDLIPDPYRVSQQFESSSYSFKTEPVPFLTDFSAFYR